MNIIYIGGYTKTEDSHFIHYKEFIQKYIDNNKNILIVALSKEPGYFTQRINNLYTKTPQVLDENTQKNIDWESLDLIYIFGGTTQKLKEGLIKFGFSLDKLKMDALLIGDSAAANILSKYYIGYTENKEYKVEKGLNPDSNIFICCHVDNEEKTPKNKIEFAKNKSEELNSKLILLKENEQVLYVNNIEYEYRELTNIRDYLSKL